MTSDAPNATTSLFTRLGGAAAVDEIVEAFYANMDRLDEARGIRAMHGRDLEPVRRVLKSYLAEWLGGPRDYSAQRGHPRLRMRHARFAIGPAERDAWMACMNNALAEKVSEPELRETLRINLENLADWMRNDPENAHDMRGQKR
jgi:hemoglobin